MLQGGPEFATWLAGRTGLRGPPRRRSDGPPVIVERDGGTLAITLHRPEVRNALDTTMRDALLESLAIARFDPSVSTVRVTGSGPDFCSGGDLDEFGTAPDPATAHRIRLSTSIGAVLHELRDRVSFEVHGASRGSGIELAAFAGRVAATGDSTFALPEVTMGLIPGAGGTVSIGRRVGRVRATTLALTGAIVDAPRALEWGLIDSIDS
ncbi:MAG: enoyl-CoA hydratase/isomerase family protein [Actinobacteria bacterium]|nr:enoyl-CoA hydratase/isomerase family protein [Actinomycetota bacterium]